MGNRILIRNLLTRYLSGKLTDAERKDLFDLLENDSNELIFREAINENLNEFSKLNEFREESSIDNNADYDKIYNNIISRINTQSDADHGSSGRSSRLKMILYISSAAAVLTGAFLLGRSLAPVQIEKLIPDPPSYTEVTSPYGSRSEIKLPDGTMVNLNAGSTLKYRNDFNRINRDIDLNGEAYFKVAKNTEIPLIVMAGDIDVIATGTEFNIKAYPEEGTIETTLIEGKVEITNSDKKSNNIESIDLVPNQKAIFYKGKEGYELENIGNEDVKPEPVKPFLEKVLISPKADIEKTVAWTEGKLIFRGENLEMLCTDLQRKYDVKFVFSEDDLKKFRFTGVLLDETLEQVLDVIKLAAPIDFSIEGKTVYLFADVKQLDRFKEYLK